MWRAVPEITTRALRDGPGGEDIGQAEALMFTGRRRPVALLGRKGSLFESWKTACTGMCLGALIGAGLGAPGVGGGGADSARNLAGPGGMSGSMVHAYESCTAWRKESCSGGRAGV